MSSQFNNAIKRSMQQPGFLLVAAVLLVGAIGLNAATSFLKLHFRKEPIPLRKELNELPKQLGRWVCVPEQHTLNPDLVHALGTDKYLMLTYVDTGAPGPNSQPIATPSEVLELDKLKAEERMAKLNDYRIKNGYSVINFAITYYTGKVDTVPHVPDRCYVADGFQPSEYQETAWDLGQVADGSARRVPLRFIDFEDQTTRGSQNRCVSYFFHANGQYIANPNEVRFKLQDLRTRHAYFAKIEVMNLLPGRPGASENDPMRLKDREAAARAMQSFLTAALPEIEKLLPDWQKYSGSNNQ